MKLPETAKDLCVKCVSHYVGVRRKGQQLQQYEQWQKPEVRSNLGEDLSLSDLTKQGRDMDSERDQRTVLWQRAHSELSHSRSKRLGLTVVSRWWNGLSDLLMM